LVKQVLPPSPALSRFKNIAFLLFFTTKTEKTLAKKNGDNYYPLGLN
jgi:hypothetical protein